MINNPSVEEMIHKLGAQDDPVSSYVLCVVAAKRARQIAEQIKNGTTNEGDNGEKEIVRACEEIASGKVTFIKD